nr:hypothetical protein REQ54_03139 [Rhizobium sp. Q54]
MSNRVTGTIIGGTVIAGIDTSATIRAVMTTGVEDMTGGIDAGIVTAGAALIVGIEMWTRAMTTAAAS